MVAETRLSSGGPSSVRRIDRSPADQAQRLPIWVARIGVSLFTGLPQLKGPGRMVTSHARPARALSAASARPGISPRTRASPPFWPRASRRDRAPETSGGTGVGLGPARPRLRVQSSSLDHAGVVKYRLLLLPSVRTCMLAGRCCPAGRFGSRSAAG
jgi:hypothetical protein